MSTILEDLHSMSQDSRFSQWDRGRFAEAASELEMMDAQVKALRSVIAKHKDRLTEASLDLEDDLITANMGVIHD